MEKMMGSMMKMFTEGMLGEDKFDMNACFQKMSSMFPCCAGKDLSEEERKTMMLKMMAFCRQMKSGSQSKEV